MSNQQSEREIFFRAIEIENPVDREVFLKQSCEGNPDLSEQIRRLLAEHDGETEILIDRQLFGAVDAEIGSESLAEGAVLGPYTLEQLLGEGGMGEVWVATQQEPIRRRVAIKLIRAGRETPGVLQRFEVERQALAAMDHPNIARVLDAGTTADRRPYFVMELVNGASLTQFCDEAELDVRNRLGVFLQAARAVQHAHQKAIIHRDLKPSNILMTMIDGKPVPKIIDFGLAKALSGNLTDDTINTQFGVVMGTLQYMAPEQAGYSGQDVDTRADVYSLGVILYELLTGLQPFGTERFDNATVEEKFRIVREQDPPLPSTRLSSSESARSFSSLRKTVPNQLSSLLRSELDWVVMKALEKDRNRRYQSASELADDISRYLAGEPVEAHPPSRAYRIKKYVRKNRGPVAAVAAITGALLLGITGTTFGLIKSNNNARLLTIEAEKSAAAEKIALIEKTDAELARNKAMEAAAEEKRQRKYSLAIAEFLQEDFLQLTTVPGQAGFDSDVFVVANRDERPDGRGVARQKANMLGKDATLKQLLDRAAEKLSQRRGLDPEIEAGLNWTVGLSYQQTGENKRAIPFFETAARLWRDIQGSDDRQTLMVANCLALAFSKTGSSDKAVELYEDSLETSIRVFGETDSLSIAIMNNLAAGFALRHNYDQAIELSEKVLALNRLQHGTQHFSNATIMASLADILSADGKLEKAIAMTDEALEIAVAHWGEEDHTILNIKCSLASQNFRLGKYDRAIELAEEILVPLRSEFHDDPHLTAETLFTLGSATIETGNTTEGLKLLEEALEIRRTHFGNLETCDLYTLNRANRIAVTWLRNGEFQKALNLLKPTLAQRIKLLGNDNPETLDTMNALAGAYRNTGQMQKAVAMWEDVLKTQQRVLGQNARATLITKSNLAGIYFTALGETDKAIEMFKDILALRREKFGDTHPAVFIVMGNLAAIYSKTKRVDEAIELMAELVDLTAARFGDEHSKTLNERANYLGLLAARSEKADDLESAADNYRAGLEIRQKVAPEYWLTFYNQSKLGQVLLRLERFEEAQPLLEAGFTGLKTRRTRIPSTHQSRVVTAIDWLIELAEATDNAEDLQKWRAEKKSLGLDNR